MWLTLLILVNKYIALIYTVYLPYKRSVSLTPVWPSYFLDTGCTKLVNQPWKPLNRRLAQVCFTMWLDWSFVCVWLFSTMARDSSMLHPKRQHSCSNFQCYYYTYYYILYIHYKSLRKYVAGETLCLWVEGQSRQKRPARLWKPAGLDVSPVVDTLTGACQKHFSSEAMQITGSVDAVLKHGTDGAARLILLFQLSPPTLTWHIPRCLLLCSKMKWKSTW